jgi:putative tricarboxylic transport membrane protein
MSDTSQQAGGEGPAHRTVEIGVVLFTALLGVLAIIGSLQVGIGWGIEGPRAGFFPFYLGVLIVISSAVNLIQATMLNPKPLFAKWGQLRQVLKVVIPTAVYVLVIPYSGIYLSSAILIAVFMSWLGRYRWTLTAAISIGVPIAVYLLFENWFLVPLPKGPIEDWLNL